MAEQRFEERGGGGEGGVRGAGRVGRAAGWAACVARRGLDRAAALPVWARYGGAVLAVLAAMLLELAVAPAADGQAVSLRVAEGVAVLAGVVLGMGPGVAGLALGVAFTMLRMPPAGELRMQTAADWVTSAIFAGTGLLAIAAAQAWQNARRRAEVALRAEQRACGDLREEIARRMRLERHLVGQAEELTRFSHIVAHDLKEPLRGIATLAHFLEEDLGPTLGPGELGLLERLKALPVRLSEMIEALLVFAEQRPGDGMPRRPRESVGMVEAAQEAVEVLGPWLAERHAVVDVDAGLPPAHCERPLAARVMCNLIANGVKYNRSPHPRVWVSARAGDQRDGGVGGGGGAGGGADGGGPRPACPPTVYCVTDNGVGIAPEHRAAVFEMFRRLHGREQFGGGTGAGLALSRRMVERMGGRMWIEDAARGPRARGEGEGPGVTICFTLEPDPADNGPVPGRAEAESDDRRGRGSEPRRGANARPARPREAT